MNSAPTIMVSSTFYDLRQIRTDLDSFISKELGYIPLLSELPSFPVDPDLDTIENCRRKVQENADIMVLIIGGRYGSIDAASDTSITNLEFLAARAKGIPIYAFVDKRVLSILPVWKENPAASFSTVTDTTRIFNFIELVRSGERVWTFEFETAQDITNALRLQLAYLMNDSLRVRKLLSGKVMPQFMEELKPRALRIALEKPDAWEHKLYFQSWLDEVDRRSSLIREYQAKLKLQRSLHFSWEEAPTWHLTKMRELQNWVDSANTLVSKSAQEAFGPAGKPGDAEQIVWVAQMMGRLLENVLGWALEIRCARIEEPFDEVTSELSLMADDFISQLASFPKVALQRIDDGLDAVTASDEKVVVDLTLTLNMANEGPFFEALERAKRKLGMD